MSSRSYTQSDGMLESGGGGRLKLLDVGEEVGTGEEIVGTGGGGYCFSCFFYVERQDQVER